MFFAHRLFGDGRKTRLVGVLGILAIAFGCSHYTPTTDSFVAIQIQDRNGVTETISTPEKLQHYENLDFLGSQPFKKILRVYKHDGKSRSIITAYHPNGTIAQYLEAKEMRASGVYREWFANGQLKIEALVIGGTADITPNAQKDWLFDGVSSVWDEDGHLIAQIPYEKGFLQGTSIFYYSSGGIQRQIPYMKNMEEGERIEFYPNGNIRSSAHFSKGVKIGKSIGFFANSQKAWEEEYTDGLILTGQYYNSHGERISKVEDGRGAQALFEGDSLAFLLEVHQGLPEGEVKKFTSKGDLQVKYFTKNGRKHGEEISYYLPPTKDAHLQAKISIQWDQGAIHGIVKTWYRNGQLQSQREYCRNQKLGPSCAWYKNGSLMLVEEYEDGNLMKGAYYKKNQAEPISTIRNGNGVAHLYDEEGIFSKKVIYAKGKPIDPED